MYHFIVKQITRKSFEHVSSGILTQLFRTVIRIFATPFAGNMPLAESVMMLIVSIVGWSVWHVCLTTSPLSCTTFLSVARPGTLALWCAGPNTIHNPIDR
ncbi:MAG: hypothetical protein GFH25_541276n40 [Chloroflexi bacterium AL-N10]|nr:hypothetical protein [Chloroflexi bacterium AL-N1]NOK71121.1 hypothetical protein [Chloroflexi bacterium AL-N10]NOK77369.1 hypothetical protein [Chloroflexi bacterium AL-N5]